MFHNLRDLVCGPVPVLFPWHRHFDMFAGGVDYAGVHDRSGASPEKAHIAYEASPISSINNWRSPALVIQGDDDRNVQFSQMVQLIESLRKQGVEFEQIVISDEVHGLILYRNLLAVFTATDEFLNRHLSRSDKRVSLGVP